MSMVGQHSTMPPLAETELLYCFCLKMVPRYPGGWMAGQHCILQLNLGTRRLRPLFWAGVQMSWRSPSHMERTWNASSTVDALHCIGRLRTDIMVLYSSSSNMAPR